MDSFSKVIPSFDLDALQDMPIHSKFMEAFTSVLQLNKSSSPIISSHFDLFMMREEEGASSVDGDYLKLHDWSTVSRAFNQMSLTEFDETNNNLEFYSSPSSLQSRSSSPSSSVESSSSSSSSSSSLFSIWSPSEEDIAKLSVSSSSKAKNKGGENPFLFPKKLSNETLKGIRLYMNEVYVQLEALETERRAHAAAIGLEQPAYVETQRGDVDLFGMTILLKELRRHFELFGKYVDEGEGERVKSHALILETYSEHERAAENCRLFLHHFNEISFKWINSAQSIENIILTKNIKEDSQKLETLPYLLFTLSEIVHESRNFALFVFDRWHEVQLKLNKQNSN